MSLPTDNRRSKTVTATGIDETVALRASARRDGRPEMERDESRRVSRIEQLDHVPVAQWTEQPPSNCPATIDVLALVERAPNGPQLVAQSG